MPIRVKVKRYLCRNCNKKSQTEFFKFFKKYFNFCNKIAEKIQTTSQRGWISLRNAKELIKE